MAKALRFKQSNIARQSGELARVRVIKGPDTGVVFVLTSSKATIGRGEDNSIVLSDLKSSRHHAELSLSGDQWTVRDTGSANGILCNGVTTRGAQLTGKDVITIGETTFEFISSLTSKTRSLVSPMPPGQSTGNTLGGGLALPQGGTGQFASGMTRQTQRIPGLGAPPATPAPKSKLLLFVSVAGIVGAIIFLGDTDKPRTKESQTTSTARKPGGASETSAVAGRDLASIISSFHSGSNSSQDQNLKTAEQFFKAGFREYRVGNYMRAKTQFDTALQIFPAHRLAKMYRDNCDARLEELVKEYLAQGKQSYDFGKLKTAKGQFEAVLRVLSRDRTRPEYIEAREQLDKVNREIAGGAN